MNSYNRKTLGSPKGRNRIFQDFHGNLFEAVASQILEVLLFRGCRAEWPDFLPPGRTNPHDAAAAAAAAAALRIQPANGFN